MGKAARVVGFRKIEDGAIGSVRIGDGAFKSSHIDRMTDDGLIFVDGKSDPSWAVVFDRVSRVRDVLPCGELEVGLLSDG